MGRSGERISHCEPLIYIKLVDRAKSRRVGLLIFNEVEELDFVGPLEVFGMAAAFGAPVEIAVIAEDCELVRGRHKLSILPEATLNGAADLDLLIVPGG